MSLPPTAKFTPPMFKSPSSAPTFTVKKGKVTRGQKVMLYGVGGVGKSTLAAHAPGAVIIDCDNGGSAHLDVARVEIEPTYANIRAVLQSPALKEYQSIVIDSVTGLQELATQHVVATITTDKGDAASSIESFGYGKGYRYLSDAMLRVLADCDAIVNSGRNVILVAHSSTRKVPNPQGEDHIAHVPAILDSPNNNLLGRVVAWCDSVLFIQSDKSVTKGKARGKGTRTIYGNDDPTYMAKSRVGVDDLLFDLATCGDLWPIIFGGGK